MEYKLKGYRSVANQLNARIYTDYFYRLMLISKSLFEWHNLPNGIDEKWIERYLFTNGECLFFKDKELGFMVTKMIPVGNLNYYEEPTKVRPYAVNFVYKGETLINNEDCVIIRNNDDSIPSLPTIEIYAFKLANIERTIDTNITAQKMPTIVVCSDKQKLSLKNAIKQRDENEPVIYGDKTLDLNQIKTLNVEAPIVFDKLQIQKHSVWNECMTFLGINNSNMDKRERMITDEVSANDEQVKASEDVMLKARQRACELINQMFGLNIWVERRKLDKVVTTLSEEYEHIDEEGETDVNS